MNSDQADLSPATRCILPSHQPVFSARCRARELASNKYSLELGLNTASCIKVAQCIGQSDCGRSFLASVSSQTRRLQTKRAPLVTSACVFEKSIDENALLVCCQDFLRVSCYWQASVFTKPAPSSCRPRADRVVAAAKLLQKPRPGAGPHSANFASRSPGLLGPPFATMRRTQDGHGAGWVARRRGGAKSRDKGKLRPTPKEGPAEN